MLVPISVPVPIGAYKLSECPLKKNTAKRLLTINREFYQSFAEPFQATRARLQPGVDFALESVSNDASALDLGCAHGLIAKFLMQRGFTGRYVGLDSSQSLLDAASDQLRPPQFQFGLADLSQPDWPEVARSLQSEANAPEGPLSPPFEWVFAFAVLHHMPTDELRRSIAAAIGTLLRPEARVAVSVWDFLASPRLQDRIVPWNSVGISDEDVDKGDYLVDWREGGSSVRYVHHFSSDELSELAKNAGFRVIEEFRSDGENSRLGLYQFWTKV